MVNAEEIESVCDAIADRAHAKKVILFGSHAYGSPSPDSDVDLLVVKDYQGQSYRAATRIREVIDPSFPMDLIVRSPAEISRRLALRDSFILEILQQGLVLYDADNPRVGAQGRSRLRRRLKSAALAAAEFI